MSLSRCRLCERVIAPLLRSRWKDELSASLGVCVCPCPDPNPPSAPTPSSPCNPVHLCTPTNVELFVGTSAPFDILASQVLSFTFCSPTMRNYTFTAQHISGPDFAAFAMHFDANPCCSMAIPGGGFNSITPLVINLFALTWYSVCVNNGPFGTARYTITIV
jgi:hypothetical protein